MKLKITIDGKTYDVEVEVEDQPAPPAPAAPYTYVPPAAPPQGAPVGDAAEGKLCRSPIAGVVVRINAQPGQTIQANDPLLVLEAMKMETNITSAISGKVASVDTGVGEPVQIGQILVHFE